MQPPTATSTLCDAIPSLSLARADKTGIDDTALLNRYKEDDKEAYVSVKRAETGRRGKRPAAPGTEVAPLKGGAAEPSAGSGRRKNRKRPSVPGAVGEGHKRPAAATIVAAAVATATGDSRGPKYTKQVARKSAGSTAASSGGAAASD